jgi:hypothetical protein
MADTQITDSREPATSVESRAGNVEQRRSFKGLARVGLLARAIVYLLLTYLSADIAAHGSSPQPADSNGAMNAVAQQPGGGVLLGVLAVGLFGYAAWRLVSAATPDEGRDTTGWAKRLGLAASCVAYLVLCAEAVSIIANSSSSSSTSSNPGPTVATVLRWPGGPEIAGAIAVGLCAGGLALAAWGCLHHCEKTLDRARMGPQWFRAAHVTGALGDSMRGLLVLLLGVYLMESAVTNDPTHVKGLDQALQSLAHAPAGTWLLAATCLGLFCFAVYSALEARYRRL